MLADCGVWIMNSPGSWGRDTHPFQDMANNLHAHSYLVCGGSGALCLLKNLRNASIALVLNVPRLSFHVT